MLHRYRSSLRSAVLAEAKAYGFALIIWGTGTIASATRGRDHQVDAIAFVADALCGMAGIIVASFGPTGALQATEPRPRLAVGAVHLGSVAAGLAAGWIVAEVTEPRWLAFFLSAAAATVTDQLTLGLEVALSVVRRAEEPDPDPDHDASGTGQRRKVLGVRNSLVVAAATLTPGLANHFVAISGISSQLSDRQIDPDRPANLRAPVDDDEDHGAHGRFDDRADGMLDPSFLPTLPNIASQLGAAFRELMSERVRIARSVAQQRAAGWRAAPERQTG